MYQLHYFPANANAAPHMLLEEIGVPYDLVLVDRAKNAQKSREYLKINPNGRIPTLVDGDLIMSEAAAIVLHLVDRHADAGLAPQVGTPERATFYQWLTFLTNSLQEELMIWQYPDRLAGEDASATDVVKHGSETRASRFLDVVEDHLKAKGPFFLGAGHALALGAPDGSAAAFASQHLKAARQDDGPPLGPPRLRAGRHRRRDLLNNQPIRSPETNPRGR